jgi:hypothetical protein
MQIAQAFQQESLLTDGHSKNMLGVTPQRRPSNGSSNTSAVSPTGSLVGNSSPNISALAASLSKQHGQRDRLSKARSSVTDMLRYSTMSTLGGLHWEDGAGEGLLTDPDETEAMVADISMSNTPLRPAVQSAAIALASARANFLTIVQENDQDPPKQISHIESDPSVNTTCSSRIKKRPSFAFIPASTPLSRSRISGTSFPSNSPIIDQQRQQQQQQMVIHETQLATLSASLERSQQRELELEKEIQKLHTKSVHEHALKKLSDQEREKALVEEIGRLETEVDGLKELNIELENSLDLATFDNLEMRTKLDRLQLDRQALFQPSSSSSSSSPPSASSIAQKTRRLSSRNQYPTLSLHGAVEKFDAFELEIVAEIAAIKDQLKLIQFIKISLALASDLVSD